MSNIVKKTAVGKLEGISDEQKHDLSKILIATVQMQSAIHTLDEITGLNNKLRFNKKKEWNNFISIVHSFCGKQEIDLYKMTAIFETIDQNVSFFDCVNRFDELANEITIEV
jgi:hypothetical protein